MKIINLSNNAVLAGDAVVADTPLARITGLLNRKDFLSGQGLVIKPCNSVHTFFMRFSIDIAFINKENKIVKAVRCLPPFRFSNIYFSAYLVVELPAGTLEKTNTREGDILSFI